jgi:NO-binding membrane sensor protein with MHYT domain
MKPRTLIKNVMSKTSSPLAVVTSLNYWQYSTHLMVPQFTNGLYLGFAICGLKYPAFSPLLLLAGCWISARLQLIEFHETWQLTTTLRCDVVCVTKLFRKLLLRTSVHLPAL